MNKLSRDAQVQVTNALCQGMSLRAITRLLNVHRTTVMDILVRVGAHCEFLHYEHVRHVDCHDLQMDEIWTFCRKKQGKCTTEEWKDSTIGDQFLFYAVDRETKVVPAWAIGKLNLKTTVEFMAKLKASLNGTVPQLSSDGFRAYERAIPLYFDNADHATVVKEYAGSIAGRGRYAPPRVSKIIRLATPI